MFVTLCYPEEVFQEIIEEALECTISRLAAGVGDQDIYQELLPHVFKYLDSNTALGLIH